MSTDNIKFELLEVMVVFVHETIKIKETAIVQQMIKPGR